MKVLCKVPAVVAFLISFCSCFCTAQSTITPQAAELSSKSAAPQGDTPAQLRILTAKRQLDLDPKKVQACNDLAGAYIRRARETADPTYLKDAEQVLQKGMSLDRTNFQLEKMQIVLMLARHEFAQAKANATLLNKQTPDDVMIYGYIAEADIALGDYSDAEKSTQWMLNMRPNNIPGLLLGARLRNLYGDPEGALDLLRVAFGETSPAEKEDSAWIANLIATTEIDSGKSDEALRVLDKAEQIFPHYVYTTENLARVRMAQHRPADAVGLLQQAVHSDPDPHVLYQLAQAQIAAGQASDANATLKDFQKLAEKLVGEPTGQFGDVDHDLIVMEAANPATAANALMLAESANKVRHDVWALDAYAWALYANGKFNEAHDAIEKAIAVGIKSAELFNHAGHIAQKLGNPADAAKYFEQSIGADPSSEFAADSRHSSGSSSGVTLTEAVTPKVETTSPLQGPPSSPAAPPPASIAQAPYNSNLPALAAPTLPAFSPVPAALLLPRPTDTDRLIRKAQARVAGNPKDAIAYSGLGAAYLQRARETGDVNDYQLAEEALTKSLDLNSNDFSAGAALQSMALVCMGEHRFDDALTYSQRALSLGSGDLSPFAIVGDAEADKGEYETAAADYARLAVAGTESSTSAAYARDSRISYLKFINGDTTGAIRLMKTAIAEALTAQLPSENLAWLYFELGEYSAQAGDAAAADAAYLSSLTIHSGDYRALAGLARLRGNRGKYAEAVVLYQKAIAVVPMPIFVAELGDLYTKMGNQVEAKKQYQLVEYIGLLGHINQVLHNRDLAIFYADHDIKLAEALELARKEFEVRHDVYTWDALSWALYKNAKYEEAGKASDKALQFGTRDSLLLYHAGMIAERLGRRDQARNELKEALTINPHFHMIYADTAQERLTLLETQASSDASGESHAR